MSARPALAIVFLLVPPLAAQTPPHKLFDAPVVYPWLTESMELLGDLDGDGDVDALAFIPATGARTSFQALHNDGSGTLLGGASVPMPPDAGTYVQTADLDGDGFLEVIATVMFHANGPGVFVFRNVGGTTWAAPVHVPVQGLPRVLGTGNANGDAFADVFVVHGTSGSNQIATWLLGGPGLTLAAGPSTSLGATWFSFGTMLDVDGDSITDVALLADSAIAGNLVALYRTTPGGFVAYGATLPVNDSNIAAGDLDGDGDTDLLNWFQQGSTQWFRTLRNDGVLGFAYVPPQSVASNVLLFGVRVADLDGDGDGDLVARSGGVQGPPHSYELTLYENSGGSFTPRRQYSIPETTLGLGAGVADLDNDGHPDCVDPHAVLFGTGSTADSVGPRVGSADDWDADGDLDELADLQLSINDGRGVMSSVAGFWPAPPAPNQLYFGPIQTADFDGDGRREVVSRLIQSFPIQFLATRRLEANGDNQLIDVGLATPLEITAGSAVDDADNDGDPDIVNGQGVWQNNGSGAFTLLPHTGTAFAPGAKGDVDGDGDQDFVAAVGSQCAIAYRVGPATYSVTVFSQPSIDASHALLVDADDDGDLDAVAPAYPFFGGAITVIAIFENTGGGVFTPTPLLTHGGLPAVADFDGDGKTDLAVLQVNHVKLLRRTGPGLTYATPVTFAWKDARHGGDLDQDGDVDLLGVSTLWNRRFEMPAAGQRRQYGIGAAGSGGFRPLLSLLGPLRSGLTASGRLVAAPGGSAGVLFVSTVEANLPNVLPGVTSWIGPSFAPLTTLLGGAPGQPGAGSAEFPIVIPPGVNGTRLFLQFIVLDPTAPIGLGHSNGCELFVGL